MHSHVSPVAQICLSSATNTCHWTTARLRRHSKTRYSACPVASGLLQCQAVRSSSFHAIVIPASPARSGMHRSGSQERDRVILDV